MSYIGAVPNSATFSPSIFYSNAQSVTVSYTLPNTQNTMSVGPITVSGTAVVTIPAGGTWKII